MQQSGESLSIPFATLQKARSLPRRGTLPRRVRWRIPIHDATQHLSSLLEQQNVEEFHLTLPSDTDAEESDLKELLCLLALRLPRLSALRLTSECAPREQQTHLQFRVVTPYLLRYEALEVFELSWHSPIAVLSSKDLLHMSGWPSLSSLRHFELVGRGRHKPCVPFDACLGFFSQQCPNLQYLRFPMTMDFADPEVLNEPEWFPCAPSLRHLVIDTGDDRVCNVEDIAHYLSRILPQPDPDNNRCTVEMNFAVQEDYLRQELVEDWGHIWCRMRSQWGPRHFAEQEDALESDDGSNTEDVDEEVDDDKTAVGEGTSALANASVDSIDKAIVVSL